LKNADLLFLTFLDNYLLRSRVEEVGAVENVDWAVCLRDNHKTGVALPIKLKLSCVDIRLQSALFYCIYDLICDFFTQILKFFFIVFRETLHSEINKSGRF